MGVASKLGNAIRLFGVDPGRMCRTLAGVPRFWHDYREYKRKSAGNTQFPLLLKNLKPFLADYTEQAGLAGGHYFCQDLWAARKIFQARPAQHLDIGSRVDGFVAHVLTFMPVQVIDIRPLKSDISGLSFIQADATNLLGIADDSVESLSSLHAIEHFGLGRYTDPIDPDACFAAMRSMQRVLKPGKTLYFSVPVGRQRVEFNGHRVFSPQTVLATFDRLKLRSFSAVDDADRFVPDCAPESVAQAYFACGMFELVKEG